MKNKKRTPIFISISILLLLLIIGCSIYVRDYYHADESALAALTTASTADGVTVQVAEEQIIFTPEHPTAGFIFYPGGKVEFSAYAPLLRQLASHDILCIVTKMPLNLAVLDMNAAEGIPEQYPDIADWYIGGHSLGGSMAASYVAEHADSYEGLVLLASYSTADLSMSDLEVISLYGSEDEVLNAEKYEEYRENLPTSVSEGVIDGGCHAYFGSYGPQDGDGIPEITAQEQLDITVELLMDFFE